MRSSAHLVGKSHVADVSDVFAGLFEFPASLCVHVCVSSTSASSLGLSGSPMHSTAPRTGKCGLSNVFSGVLKPSPTLCMAYYLHAWAALEPIRFVWARSCAPGSR